MKKYYDNKLEMYYMLLKEELKKCEDLLTKVNMERIANQNQDIDELYNLDDYYLEIHMYDTECSLGCSVIGYEEEEVRKSMIEQIIEELGYDSNQFKDQIATIELELEFYGRMWRNRDDIVMNILSKSRENLEDLDGACKIIDMLEKKFGYSAYLHHAIAFRDRCKY